MKPNLTISVLCGAFALLAGTPAGASTVSDTSPGSLLGGGTVLMDSVGFVKGTQIFSDSINLTSAGTLTVKLADIPWLDALQNLNCFVSTAGGGVVGGAQNGLLDSVDVQAGTVYVNWYGKAAGPLSLGVYAVTVNFQPVAPPVPLPAPLMLMVSGLAALVAFLRRSSLSSVTGR